jgi:hypothetical protein
MKPSFDTKAALARYFKFTPATERDEARLEKAWAMYTADYRGDGCMGCVAELLTATKNSGKKAVSTANAVDCYVRFRAKSGKVIPVAAERKTNGGRVSYDMKGKYVVYSMDICNATTSNLRRRVPAVVIPKALFMAKLEEFGAIKAVNKHGELDGYAIQPSKKAWYEWLLEWPIVYNRDAVYCESDFEGLA